MSSPPSDGLSTSPMSIRIAHRDRSPIHRRGSSPRDPSPTVQRNRSGSENHERTSDSPTLARHSPSITRANYNPLDPDVRERQRTLDADMAMHLSRARRSSVSSSPVLQSSFHEHDHRPGPLPHDCLQHEHLHHEEIFPTFSLQEEQDLETARRGPEDVDDVTGLPHDESTVFQRSPSPELGGLPHLSQAHEPALLAGPQLFHHSATNAASPDMAETGLPMYQPPAMAERQAYKFGFMEEFAREEKQRLGLVTPGDEHPSLVRKRTNASASGGGGDAGPSTAATADFTLPPTRPARERKLSHSNTVPRRQGGKMALFEAAAPPPPPSLTARPHLGVGRVAPDLTPIGSAMSSVEALPHVHPILPIAPGAGHDRPYRFSFFSNALAATIHARSLSELPAEGQSFEDMFLAGGARTGSTPADSAPSSMPRSGVATPPFPADFKAVNGARAGISGAGLNGDVESHTWWLDVLSPTDEEMKMLTQVFGLHPLTTEDIQMEEAREKIELFRTYYLVCFRSFDQDPYSPTHLEPVNMYMVVFREGILSFHFRPTPHPQNVRRRIKQLRDYISVTSDWISYALIDDITDAFGPLIQNIEYEVDSIDELVLILKEAEQSDMLRRIGTCRKKVMGLLRLMGNKADVVKGLAKRCNEKWKVAPTSDIGLYLSDIQDHLITMTQNLNHYEKILSRSHSNYLAQISIEMTDANNQINDVLSKLTALGTILVPMNLITGLWGMNVHVPGQDVPGFAWFGSIIGVLAAIAMIGGYTTYKLMVR